MRQLPDQQANKGARMAEYRNYLLLFGLPIVIALPAVAIYTYAQITDDPRLRPLGITREKLSIVEGESEFLSIIVRVDWGRDHVGRMTKEDLHQTIAGTLVFRTDDFYFKFNDVPGTDIKVTFDVGHNSFGPYSPKQLIGGIIPALRALDVTKKARS